MAVRAASIQGNGTLEACGGDGGYAETAGGGGGGGGGGVVGLFNSDGVYVDSQDVPVFNFTGTVVLTGGAGGGSPSSVLARHASHPTLSPTHSPLRPTARPSSRFSAPVAYNASIFPVAYSNATPGSSGRVSWPHCLAGFGNIYALSAPGTFTVTTLCDSCALGSFSAGGQGLCGQCNAIPPQARSVYSGVRQRSAACVCACLDAFPVLERGSSCQAGTTDVCLTAFGYFMYIAFGGVYQFAGTCVGIAVFFGLVVWRRRLLRLLEKEEKIVFRKVGFFLHV